MKHQYHVIVIGAGSGGLMVAAGAANLGAKVALIEKRKMGGDCLNYGCVPSKAFLRSAHLAGEINHSADFNLAAKLESVNIESVMARVKSKIEKIAPNDSIERYEKMGVKVFIGEAKLLDNHSIMVNDEILTGKFIVIATGSKARIPDSKGLDTIKFYTNETIFDIKTLPKHLIVVGGGPIGLELGQGFSQLGSRVTIIDSNPKLFNKDDPEVWDAIKKPLEDDGVNFKLNCKIDAFAKTENEIQVSLNNGEKIMCDAVLVSAGRVPQAKFLEDSDVKIKLNRRGFVETNDKLQTSVKNIYAVGDVTGPFLFTHTAGYQASIVVQNMFFPVKKKVEYKLLSWTTYTKPEVAHVGFTEDWAKKEGLFGSTIIVQMKDVDRSICENDETGFLKLILNRKGKIIGCTIVGNRAGELLGAASMAMSQNLTPKSFLTPIFAYPTQLDAYKFAAYQQLKSSFKPWMKSIIKKVLL
jgi:pyruvate/2-oxoglutarate dehydrogenase complex dihydrolipoamide dehydrogenase (E3) component